MARLEASFQRAVACFLRLALMPPTIWTAFPSGGGGRIRGAQLKAMGLSRGWPDILVIHPAAGGESSIVLGIELKTAKGRVSPEQEAMHVKFIACNAWYVVCRDIAQVESACRYAGIPLRTTPMESAA